MKKLFILLLAISSSACVPSFNPFSDEGLKVDVQAGKTNEKTTGVKAEEFSVSKVEDTTTADTVIEDTKVGTIEADEVSIDERVPLWVWLLVILGWILPSPAEIYKGLGNLIIKTRDFIRGK